MKRPEPKAVVWHVLWFGPAVTMLGVAVLVLALEGWSEGWVPAMAYLVAAANMWLAGRNILPNYRTGYYHGRVDLLMERMGVQPERGPGDRPGPWDDPMSPATMARVKELAERGELREED